MTLGEGPAREKVRRGSWILGLLAAASLVVFFADEVRQELAEGPSLWITAEASRGLAVGSPVWLAGHRVGRVASIRVRAAGVDSDRTVLVRAVIREADADRLRADASAVLRPAGLMEPTVVSIRPGSAGAEAWNLSDTLRARTSVTTAELRRRLERTRAALDSLGRAEKRVRALASSGDGTLAKLRRDEELRRRLRRQADGIARLSALARSDSSDVGLLSRSPGAARLPASLAAADSLAVGLERAAARWAALDRRLASLGDRARRLRTLLEEARGSAGRFLHDDALRRELEELRAGVREAQAAILADPFAWLRFRLF